MGFLDWLGLAESDEHVESDFFDEPEGEVIQFAMNPDDPETSSRVLQAELGSTGQTLYTDLATQEYNVDLIGNRGLKVYDQMRRSDGQVRGTLRLVKTPITAAQWYVDPAGDSPLDIEAANFINWNLNERLRIPWVQFLWEALYMLDYGFYPFEKVYAYDTWQPDKVAEKSRPRSRPVVVWDKFAPRHPKMVSAWNYTSDGEVDSMQFIRVDGASGFSSVLPIPADRLLIFTLDGEAGNPEGMSILRSAYMHWFYKQNLYKIDAIQKERHGIGIPRVKLPMGYTQPDKLAANRLGQNLRTNEKANVTLPPGWEVDFIELTGQPVDALASASHHSLMIAKNILAPFFDLGSGGGGGPSGSRATSGDQIQIFMKALKYITDIIRGVMNVHAIPELIGFNYDVNKLSGFPQLKVRRIGETADWRALSAAFKNMVDSGILTPDDETEVWMRDQMDMPRAPATTLGREPDERLSAGKPGAQDVAVGDSTEQAARDGNTSKDSASVPPEGRPN